MAALKSGQLDIVSTPFGGDTADQMKDDPNITIHTVKFGTARMSIWPKHSGEISTMSGPGRPFGWRCRRRG